MKYTQSDKYRSELQDISNFLELINFRPRTVDAYLQCIFEACCWLEASFAVGLKDASVSQLRAFLLHLRRSHADGGMGYTPRTVNIYNCAIKKYFRYVMKQPLDSNELPLCRIDRSLPKVPTKPDVFKLIYGTKNLKHRLIFAIAYGCALRIGEVAALRFGDIYFSENTVHIPADISKNRREGKVELPDRLKQLLIEYAKQCCPEAKKTDWLFPGQKAGTHLSRGTLGRIFKKRILQLGWETRGYTFHSLRHAHALHYYQAGADLFQVMYRLRHNSIASTLIYVQLDATLKGRKDVGQPLDDPDFAD